MFSVILCNSKVDAMIDEDIGQLLGAIKRDDAKAIETAGSASGVMMKGFICINSSLYLANHF